MQLSAPRQGLFALVLFIGFVLQAFFTIYSIRSHQSDLRATQAELLLKQLSQEFAPTVLAKDTVGLSLLANRYAHQQDINSLIISAKNGDILSQVGQNQTRQGETFTGDITLENEPVGNIQLNLMVPSRGDVIASQWPLFLASALLYLGLWLLYRIVASQYVVVDALPRVSHRHQQPLTSDTESSTTSGIGINRTANASPSPDTRADQTLSAKQPETTTQSTASSSNQNSVMHDESGATGMTSFLRTLSDLDDPIILQIQFDDPKSLLMKLSPTISKPYYQLCNQLLATAIDELSFSGQIAQSIHFEQTAFAEDGVHIVATHAGDIDSGIDEHKADIAHACMLLAKLYMLLHDITYARHREINRFALETKACISRKLNQPMMAKLLEFNAHAHSLFVLLEPDDLTSIQDSIDIQPYPNPTTVLQRKVGIVTEIHPTLTRPLGMLRDKILG